MKTVYPLQTKFAGGIINLTVQFQYLTQPDPEVRGVCKVKVFASMLTGFLNKAVPFVFLYVVV